MGIQIITEKKNYSKISARNFFVYFKYIIKIDVVIFCGLQTPPGHPRASLGRASVSGGRERESTRNSWRHCRRYDRPLATPKATHIEKPFGHHQAQRGEKTKTNINKQHNELANHNFKYIFFKFFLF